MTYNPSNISESFKQYCLNKGIKFQDNLNVLSYDDTTLFCPAGMQQFKDKFKDVNYKGTIANIQPCIRLNDLDNVGDGRHLALFNMIGLFSFRQMSVFDTIDFFMGFLNTLGITLTHITIHPDKVDWISYYNKYLGKQIKGILFDEECKWTDGEIGGYCTEFYFGDIEIGNIVNPLGDCIDVGFGLERLEYVFNYMENPISRIENISKTCLAIINAGIEPSNIKQGYILRKLLREVYKLGGKIEHKFFEDEIKRQEIILNKYNRLKDKNKDKSKEWWFETHGIDIESICCEEIFKLVKK